MEYDSNYTHYQLKRSYLRKIIRKIYLQEIVKKNIGKAIDFGCGVGELLEKLPEGSLGFDINSYTVNYCKSINLNVDYYNQDIDKYNLYAIEQNKYQTLILSHVLEHLENPAEKLKLLFNSAQRLNILRIIIVVPCIKGFNFDKTHIQFIDKDFFFNNAFDKHPHFNLSFMKYFPFNNKLIGKFFTYNELHLIFDKIN